MERADDGGRVNIRDIVLYPAGPQYILAETLASLLGNDMQVACLAMGLVTSSKGAHKLMAQIRPGGNRVYRQVHQPRHGIGFKSQWKAIRKHLIVAGSSSLHRDGVDVEELRRVSLVVVLFANVRFEGAVSGPLELPQLTGKSRTAYLVR